MTLQFEHREADTTARSARRVALGTNSALARAFDDQRTGARVGVPDRQSRLVFWRVVPAARSSGVGKLDDYDALRLGAALEQLGPTTAREETPTILRDAGAGEGPVGLVSSRVGDLDLGNEIGRHVVLLWANVGVFTA